MDLILHGHEPRLIDRYGSTAPSGTDPRGRRAVGVRGRRIAAILRRPRIGLRSARDGDAWRCEQTGGREVYCGVVARSVSLRDAGRQEQLSMAARWLDERLSETSKRDTCERAAS